MQANEKEREGMGGRGGERTRTHTSFLAYSLETFSFVPTTEVLSNRKEISMKEQLDSVFTATLLTVANKDSAQGIPD